MVINRLVEFFEGDDHRLSMMRLTVFMSFFPSSYILVTHATEGMLGWYIGGYVLGYVGGKTTDIFMKGNGNVAASRKK